MTNDARNGQTMVAVVTGAGRGIGAAIAAAFADRGAVVVVADIDEAAAAAQAERLRAVGECEDRILAMAVDVASPHRVDELFDTALDRLGRVDVVVNNAGLVHVTPFEELSLCEWQSVFRVNADGTFLMTRRAGVVMRMQSVHPLTRCRGKIVNVSSMAAEHGRTLLAAYGASKAAVNHVSATAALAFGADEIATTVVYPGNIRDGMWRDLGGRIAAVEGRTVAAVEGERVFQTAESFARVVTDVASESGMGLNGAVVDGATGAVVVRSA